LFSFFGMISLHPSLKIIALCLFALLANHPNHRVLFALGLCIAMLLIAYQASNFFKLINKVKWLLVVMLCLYAVNTPGEYLAGWTNTIAPTYEGLWAGFKQAYQLSLMVAGVALLLKTTTSQQLVAGLYYCLRPMRFLGLAPARFAVRLWLTMEYVNSHRVSFKLANVESLIHSMQSAQTMVADDHFTTHPSLKIELPIFTMQDACVLLLMLVITGGICVLL
jgi:energy-coupling factor transporter transmembrane protein EcfT